LRRNRRCGGDKRTISFLPSWKTTHLARSEAAG
jgi:hypothetical protein